MAIDRVAENRRMVVVGLGQTGYSCVRYLCSKGFDVAVVDSRENPPGAADLRRDFPQVSLNAGSLDVDILLSAGEIVLSPGVALAEPELQQARKEGIPIVGDIDLFCRVVSQPIVAITGSNAKSTVTELVGLMARESGLKVKVGGNIGIPVLDLLSAEDSDQTELYVLELSSFQLETIHDMTPLVATVLNISEDHMDRYEGMQPYVAAKHRIFNGCHKIVVNRDDPLSQAIVGELVESYSFGVDVETDEKERVEGQQKSSRYFGILKAEGLSYLACGNRALMEVNQLGIMGKHNVANALAALALGSAAGLDMKAMLESLKSYRGLPHRCQWIGTWREVEWFNDSKGTNVGATLAAIEGLADVDSSMNGSRQLILIAGGLGKGQDFSPLRAVVSEKVKHTLLIGEDALRLQEFMKESTVCNTLQQAVKLAAELAHGGDRVLFSPACASFDMFAGFEDRGDQFVTTVKALFE